MSRHNGKIELHWPNKGAINENIPLDELDSIVEVVLKYKRAKGIILDLKGKNKQEWLNQFYWGDNRILMHYLLKKGYSGKIDMIYIDPPFFSGLDFAYWTQSGKRKHAFKDSWHAGLPHYLNYMYPRLKLMWELLKDGGTIYVHLDWHVAHYVKVLMDEIFGYENFRNQIIWKRLTYKQTQVMGYGVLHDVILYYTKGPGFTWNDIRIPYDVNRLKKYFCWLETENGKNIKLTKAQLNGLEPIPAGRRFALNPIINPNPNRPNLYYEFLGFKKVWKYTKEKMLNYYKRGIVFQPSPGTIPKKKQYLDESPGMKLNDIFLDISGVMGTSKERLDYETQKPEKLLARLIKVSSNPGDLVADFFCGSGTTLAVAQKTGRKWIGCDISKHACHIIIKRMMSLNNADFAIYMIKYPHLEARNGQVDGYRDFMVKLHQASIFENEDDMTSILNENNKMIHVVPFNIVVDGNYIDHVVEKVTKEQNHLDAIDILSVSYRLNARENPSFFSKKRGITVSLYKMPDFNEIASCLIGNEDLNLSAILSKINFDKRKTPLHTFKIPELELDVSVNGTKVELCLKRFEIDPGHKSSDAIPRIIDPVPLLDAWLIDWNYNNKYFMAKWRSFRDKHGKGLVTKAAHDFKRHGKYTIAIMMFDVFGNQSGRLLPLTLPENSY
ncbi:MAG: site-specific DNA-methyltransferase [Promethearchaeota archaeon]